SIDCDPSVLTSARLASTGGVDAPCAISPCELHPPARTAIVRSAASLFIVTGMNRTSDAISHARRQPPERGTFAASRSAFAPNDSRGNDTRAVDLQFSSVCYVPRVPRALSSIFVVTLFVTVHGSAHAGESASEADVLFDEARDLMVSGNFAEACPKLERSE